MIIEERRTCFRFLMGSAFQVVSRLLLIYHDDVDWIANRIVNHIACGLWFFFYFDCTFGDVAVVSLKQIFEQVSIL